MKRLGKNVSFRFPIMIDAPACVTIGDNVVVPQQTWISIQGEKKGEKVRIGKNTSLERRCSISAAKHIVIGENVIFGPNVYITDHIHAYEDNSLPIKNQGITKISPVTIGDDSWLGVNVVVLPGAKIGKHCVIGANSVVLNNIPDYSVAVGSPAKVVRMYNKRQKRWMKIKK
jgi:acetyltransferase-like isoleucine patch superfamily enzyme